MASPFIAIPLLLLLFVIPTAVRSSTEQSDVNALGNLYISLNSPPQLAGWASGVGDPCGNAGSWKGITCSGSSVIAIELSGLGLNGTLGYRLSDLLSLKKLDLSNNNVRDTIPYQLPPNLTYLDLAGNNLSGNVPYSISMMISLNYLNLSHNALSQSISADFTNLQDLSDLDLSFNNLVDDLPNSFSLLSNLSTLYLQNNQLTGSVNVLANLDLSTLNIANNHFSGWIPQEFSFIPDLLLGGNSFDNGPAPPPPPFMPPPPRRSRRNHNSTSVPVDVPHVSDSSSSSSPESDKKNLSKTSLIGISIGSVLVALLIILTAILCLRNLQKQKDDDRKNAVFFAKSDAGIVNKEKEMLEQNIKYASFTNLISLPANQVIIEKSHGRDVSGKQPKIPITATQYAVATLQVATNSFGQDCLVGEGSFGRVYRAEFPTGKVLAVKKVDSAAISLQEEDNFIEAVSNMSRFRHPNIVTLVGYCVEYGQRLLVYEYIGNGTLHDVLHFADERSKMLSWNARVRVALGTARALEYLHEVCLPPVVHRNFKSANILLDEELNPHLSDCGLAALTPNTERQVSTEVVGSFGYSAPEFAMSGLYTIKSDVYSFGVVMLELLTGRKPLDSSRPRSEQSLVRWASPQLHDIDALAKMVDPALNGIYPVKSLSRFADIIALCVQHEPEFRPPMSEVVQQLVQLLQRASAVRKRSGDDIGLSYRVAELDGNTADTSF